ncbi:hypothetical protein INT45_009799 [Circinella minor]|uniref:SWIM-type domain-containing protein n=1 Tax=Circinella minor TaxID=1195481 RepID=A0A8H7RDZ5_9FUNG|nr:hypothetical protein INT45_009799 [Circinella minor]
MNQQQQHNELRVYTIQNVRYALAHSLIPGVLRMVPNQPFHVIVSEWKECLAHISELCSVRWVHKRRTNGTEGGRVVYSETFYCHRAGSYDTQRTVRTQKDSKKCNCSGVLKVTILTANSTECKFELLADHDKYTPGDEEDVKTLKLTAKTFDKMIQQLQEGRNCRDIRISLLHQFDSISDVPLDDITRAAQSSAGHRKVNYNDVYNQMRKLKCNLFEFHDNDMFSVKTWLDEHLANNGYTIYSGNISECTSFHDIFYFGFVSSRQLTYLQQSTSVCMDATHNISSRINDVLYSIVTRDRLTGVGQPIAYMFTNDQSAYPIGEWLRFLREMCGLTIENLTIDCSIPEVNAMHLIYPDANIHYCAFHVLQAWNRNLGSKVSLESLYERYPDRRHTDDALQQYRGDMLTVLKSIMHEQDIDTMYNKVNEFKRRFYEQTEFLSYFETYWEPEHLIQRWTFAFTDPRDRAYLTNNMIETWFNQLKTVYLRRVRNKRLDRLIFILTNEVEFYFINEHERILRNNGRMGPLENQQSRRRYRAAQVPVRDISAMIQNPEGGNASDPMTGFWKVMAFVPQVTRSTPRYEITVNSEMLIKSCTCLDFSQRRAPCKHMYLLKRYTNMQVHFEVEQRNALRQAAEAVTLRHGELNNRHAVPRHVLREQQQQQQQEIIIIDGDDEYDADDSNIDILNSTQDNLQFVSQTFTSFHHDRTRVLEIPTITQEESQQYAQRVRELLLFHEEMMRRHHHRRTANTQRH